MLRHQLAAPLAFDLGNALPDKLAVRALDPALQEAGKLGIKSFKSFQDLFTHANPPLELLVSAKNIFKRQSGSAADRRPEQQVAYVLYLLTILMAKARCGRPITKLGDDAVSRSAQWALSQEWVDAATKSLLTQALQTPKHLACPSEH